MQLMFSFLLFLTLSSFGAENIWISFPKSKKNQREFIALIKSEQSRLKKSRKPRRRMGAFLNIKLAEHLSELVENGCDRWPGQFFTEFGIKNQIEPSKDMNASMKQFHAFVNREVCLINSK